MHARASIYARAGAGMRAQLLAYSLVSLLYACMVLKCVRRLAFVRTGWYSFALYAICARRLVYAFACWYMRAWADLCAHVLLHARARCLTHTHTHTHTHVHWHMSEWCEEDICA